MHENIIPYFAPIDDVSSFLDARKLAVSLADPNVTPSELCHPALYRQRLQHPPVVRLGSELPAEHAAQRALGRRLRKQLAIPARKPAVSLTPT